MTQKNGTQKPNRILVVGLDGATFDLINLWVAQGLLPTFQRLLAEGAHGPLRTITPPLTGPAWVSFFTGKEPGTHGIYDFVIRSETSYNGRPISTAERAGESLWSILSRAGKRVGVFMVPVTYPPEPVNGFMVSGMLTPSAATDYSYPRELARDLQEAVPDMTVAPESVMHPLGREKELLAGLDKLSDMMMAATNYLMSRYDDWDFFMTVFKEPDVAMHWLWRFMDPDHPWYTAGDGDLANGLQQVYQRMDQCLADLVTQVGPETLLLIMSDHGAGPLESYFYVNDWLIDQGFMQLKSNVGTWGKRGLYKAGLTPVSLYRLLMRVRRGGTAVAQTMRHRRSIAISLLKRAFLSFDNVDWAATKAYSLGNYGQIYLNVRGREPQGIIRPGEEYEQVMQEIITRLGNLVDPRSGDPIPGRAYRSTELYQGKRLDQAPDIVFMPDDLNVNGFGLYQFPSKSWLEPTFDRSGGHRMDGILMAYGPQVKKGETIEKARIIDLAPTILAALQVPIPNDMEGRVLTELFAEPFWDGREIQYASAANEDGDGDAFAYSAAEEEEVRERLRSLGYMG